MILIIVVVLALLAAYGVWRALGPQNDTRQQVRRGPIGPDDDPDFLLDLKSEHRRGPSMGDDSPPRP